MAFLLARMRPKDKLWYFGSKRGSKDVFVLVRSPFKRMAQKKVRFITDGHGVINWEYGRVKEDQAKIILEKYELNALYEADDDKEVG